MNGRMEETYNCGEGIREHEHNNKKLEISTSGKYSMASLESINLKDYLKSFSQTHLEIKDSLKCLYQLKQKSERNQKFYKNMKPYSRNKQCAEPFESNSSMHVPITLKNHFPSMEQDKSQETKDTANTKYLKVTDPNGTTTEITLQPVILMHVREIPVGIQSSDKEMYQIGSTINTSSSPQVNTKFLPQASDPQVQFDYESQNHQTANILRVKSSRNSTDLSSERKLSCMKMNKNVCNTTEDFRRPSSKQDPRMCVNSNIGSKPISMGQNNCYHDHNSIPDGSRCLGALLENVHEKNDMTKVLDTSSGNTKHGQPQVNYSTTTFFRHPTPRSSNTSGTFIQAKTYSQKQPKMEMK